MAADWAISGTPDWRSMAWYAKPDDLVGGWCIGVDERPPSEGAWTLGDFMNEDVARYIVGLHNQAIGGGVSAAQPEGTR
jgi:hypothetical protein